jgi:hypothetical protein
VPLSVCVVNGEENFKHSTCVFRVQVILCCFFGSLLLTEEQTNRKESEEITNCMIMHMALFSLYTLFLIVLGFHSACTFGGYQRNHRCGC